MGVAAQHRIRIRGTSPGPFRDGLRLFSVVTLAKGLSAHFDFEGVVKKPVAERVGESGFPHGRMPVFRRELAGEDGGGLAVTILDDFEKVGPFLVGQGR